MSHGMTYRRMVQRGAAAVAAVLVMMVGSAGEASAQSSLKVFLDCSQCDFNNLRQDITYVSYVNAVSYTHLTLPTSDLV